MKNVLYKILFERGITHREFAEMTGFNETYVHRLIHQKSCSIEFEKLGIICSVLMITPNDFFGIEK
jgi:DNA-binding Xre family transcriptional regulator